MHADGVFSDQKPQTPVISGLEYLRKHEEALNGLPNLAKVILFYRRNTDDLINQLATGGIQNAFPKFEIFAALVYSAIASLPASFKCESILFTRIISVCSTMPRFIPLD
jgi:hypothetical protein